MDRVESLRKECLHNQTELRGRLENPEPFDQAISLFLQQHALLHSQDLSQAGARSFADAVLCDLSDAQMRRVPPGGEHSVAWLIWHMARCEDITLNLLVAGRPQILLHDGWLGLIKSPICDTGNAMEPAAIAYFSATIDLEALRAYRLAVGRGTQAIVRQLQPADLMRKVEPARIQQVMDQGAVTEAAREVVDYWSRRTVAGLLLMPATRHNLVHLGEILQFKRRIG